MFPSYFFRWTRENPHLPATNEKSRSLLVPPPSNLMGDDLANPLDHGTDAVLGEEPPFRRVRPPGPRIDVREERGRPSLGDNVQSRPREINSSPRFRDFAV